MFDFLRSQFVDVIDWTEERGQLAWRVPFDNHEIQNGAKLTVREGQVAVMQNEGHFADVFGPGLHRLETANLPLLTSLKHWETGFRSPFKTDVIFFTLREQTGQKWGTAQPITVRDKELGPIRLRAFGTYSYKIKDIPPFSDRLLGTLGEVTTASLEQHLRAAIQTSIATALGGSDVPFLDLAANQQALSDRLQAEVDKTFDQWGLSCLTFYVESISLPDEVQAHLDRASSMRLTGDLNQYTRFQAANAIEAAAGQDGGMAGIGAGVAAAAVLGNTVSQSLGSAAAPVAAAAVAEEDPIVLIEKLHKLVTLGALSQAEFDTKKAELLARLK